MSSHRPRRTEQIRDASGLLEAMGRCRRVVLEAQDSVKPFGVMFHGCAMVTASMDALAYLLTGHAHYYSIAGSVSASSGQVETARALPQDGPVSPDPESKTPERRRPDGPGRASD